MKPIPKVALVTGATGFIGSNIASKLLLEGWKVHVLCRNIEKFYAAHPSENFNVHMIDGSTTNLIEHMRSVNPDVVFHLASYFIAENSSEDIETLINSNVKYGTQLLEAMSVSGVRNIVNTGTSWQHYKNEEYNPVCLYAATKQAFEAIMDFYVKSQRINAITLKLFDTYGVGDCRNKLFKILEDAFENGASLNMSMGEQLIDLVYIDDVVSAYFTAIDRLYANGECKHERFAVSSGTRLSLRKVVDLYSEISKKKISVNWGSKPYREREVMMPTDRAEILPHWKPMVRLSDGLLKITNYKFSKRAAA